MKNTTPTSKRRNSGLRHSEIREREDASGKPFHLIYTYHGSSFVHNERFADLKEAQARQSALRQS